MTKSKIEWTDATWNPIRAERGGRGGWHCEKVSPGCAGCYAEAMNAWRGTGDKYNAQAIRSGRVRVYLSDVVADPLSWKKPRMIFVCSMTDLFADFVERDWIANILGVIAYCRQHTFQVLTKRAERMRALMQNLTLDECLNAIGLAPHFHPTWPPENLWLGVSVEDQARAEERIPHLLATPAAVRFLSCEPLLGPVDLRRGIYGMPPNGERRGTSLQGIDWVIAGGESGAGARPMHPDWARGLRDQCQAAGVPFHFKQWGEWAVSKTCEALPDRPGCTGVQFEDGTCMQRVGKKSAGRELDGRTWDELPEPVHA